METSQRIPLGKSKLLVVLEWVGLLVDSSQALSLSDDASTISSSEARRLGMDLSRHLLQESQELTHRAHAHKEGNSPLSNEPDAYEGTLIGEEELAELLEQSPAPRVTLAGIKDKIAAVTFYPHRHLTICVAELYDGFFVTGTSCPVSPENYNERVGRHYAFADCIRQCWQLEGRLLRHNLYLEETGTRAGK